MNLDSLSFALSQISYSVANLTKKNYKTSVAEIKHLIAQHGAEADRHLFRCLFSHVDFSGDGKSSGKDFHQTQYLVQEAPLLISKPNFVSTLCYAIDNPLHHQKSLKPSPHLFGQLSKILKLSRVQEVVFGVALLSSSNKETRQYSTQFVKQKLPQLLSYLDNSSGVKLDGSLVDIATEVLHLILTNLLNNKEFGISEETKDAFIAKLKSEFTQNSVPVVLAPLLSKKQEDNKIQKLSKDKIQTMSRFMNDKPLADMILEIGYGCTASGEEMRNTILQFGTKELDSKGVAKVLGMMTRTATGLTDHISLQTPGSGGQWNDGKDKPDTGGPQSWNVDIFVQVIRDLAPHIKWQDVVHDIDYPGFEVPNKNGFRLLIQAFRRGFQEVMFPVELLYRPWENSTGQLSWFHQSLKNPDVFCLADLPYHSVDIGVLKTPPDEENREIATWKSKDLVETLLRLAERGHYQVVSELFKFPVMHCPDMLVLALLQIPTWTTLKHELLSSQMPVFLGNHANSAIVLQYAWHNCQGQSTTIRTIVMHSMAEWYMRGEYHDQSRLSRILDVAQDLKALSMLLNATPFAFVIDLACLASRREYLKLDKWLSDKTREHGEPFIQACVHFLKRRCPQLLGPIKDDHQSKSQQLPPETVTTMLACLQACTRSVNQELQEAIVTMIQNAHSMLNKARQAQAAPQTPNPASVIPMVGGPKPNQLGPTLTGIPNQPGPSPMDQLGGISLVNALASSRGQTNPTLNPALPASLASSLTGGTPGSPGKSFPNLPPSSNAPGLNPMQSLGPQIQGPDTGSPAKQFPVIGNPAAQVKGGYNPIQSLSSQMQDLSMQTTMSTGLGTDSRITPTLGPLQQAAALGKTQQPPGRQTTPGGGNQSQPQGGDIANIFPPMNQQFSKEIEDEANGYFQRIYNHPPHPTISIDEVLDMLRSFKDSQNKKEKDVFACMLRNLFEEYKFFPQYPDKELHTTAVLFGGIIEQGLVTYMYLGIALRYVLEALKKPHGSKMYFFGIAALDKFKTRLKDYPQYCLHLASIPHFAQFPQHLKEYIEYGGRSQEPPNRPQGPINAETLLPPAAPATTMPAVSAPATANTSATTTSTPSQAPIGAGAISRPAAKPSIANVANIDTLIAGQESAQEEVKVPPEQMQDKVFFIFNNLSIANMDAKASELLEHISDEYLPWVAQYLVMKRASIEHNFHVLYAKFLDHLKKRELTDMVVNETYRNIKVLLRSDKGVANFSDRSLLKNLGHWLGMLSLAKNLPILHDDIDLKSLLYEAFHKGSQELLYVVPFVAKVLESCAQSRVFKPPNPWTIAIMEVLADLHSETDLKLNLKFEIEVLCKNLNLDIAELVPRNYLRDADRITYLDHQLSAKKMPESSTPQPEEPLQINMPTPVTTMNVATPTTTTTTAPAPPVTGAMQPTQPMFGYHEINVLSLAGLVPHMVINEELELFVAHAPLKQLVRPAIERSVQELLPPVVDRSIKVALTTCEQIVKKDFALDSDETRMRAAAHRMARFMTSGMALITCREPLLMSINSNLKTSFLTALRQPAQHQKDMIENAAQIIAQDNVELACAFILKSAVEKAIPEIDKKLANEYDFRKIARNEGRRYCDPVVLTYQAERMPEQIRLKVGGVTHQQITVYEEFARSIPGFHNAGMVDNQQGQQAPRPAAPAQESTYLSDVDILTVFDKIARDLEQRYQELETHMGSFNMPSTGIVAQLTSLIEHVTMARKTIITPAALVQRAVEGLLEDMSALPGEPKLMLWYRECYLRVLKALFAVRQQWLCKEVTRCLIECRDEYRYNIEAVDCLIKNHMVIMSQYDLHLATSMENGLNYVAVAFAMQLVQRFCVDDKHAGTSESDFFNTIETLARIASHSRQAPEGLASLIETVYQQSEGGLIDRAPGGPTSMMQSGLSQAREFDDPAGLHEKTEYLLREWVQMYHSAQAGRDSTKAFSAFVGQMHQQGILKTDDLITRFFRLCTEMCVDLCYRALSEQNQSVGSSPVVVRAKCFYTLDAFVRLIALLVKHSGDTTNTVTKINLLNKVLGIVAGVLLQDHEVRHTEFQQLPYHRIFIMLFIELNAPEHILESINFQVLTAFCNTFHILRPSKAPGFAYAWLELVSHRVFIGRTLVITSQHRNSSLRKKSNQGWSMYAQLLIDLFKFLAPFLRNAELQKPIQLIYKGSLRLLLVLLHDFPDFFCDYHYPLCDVIPPNCIQMRNLILSAFPRNMRLPDPFTPNLKVDMLPEIAMSPRIMTNFVNMIQPPQFKKDLDSYLKTRSPVTFLSDLRSNLQITNEPGNRYNIPLLNALVLYVGTQAIQFIHQKSLTPSMSTIAHSSHMDIFQNLAVDLDTEGRYLFLNAIANQLRYPNSHTHYFSCTLLYLFSESNTESIQEQITRVLLERLIVNRPHPWGLLITFIELIKNPQFKFWNHEFVHCAPEIEKLFEAVARSCLQTRQTPAPRDADTPQQTQI